MPNNIIPNCDKCKHTDTKSSRYPCSECNEYALDKWEAPKSKAKLRLPLLYEGNVIGYSIYDSENNRIDVTVLDPDSIKELYKDKDKHKGISIGFYKDAK